MRTAVFLLGVFLIEGCEVLAFAYSGKKRVHDEGTLRTIGSLALLFLIMDVLELIALFR
jgi:hypothetical protein